MDMERYQTGYADAVEDIQAHGLAEVLRILSYFDHDQSDHATGYRTAVGVSQERLAR